MSKEAAIKEYLHELETNCEYRAAAYRSFRKGEEVARRLEQEIGAKHGVDPEVLRRAEVDQRADIFRKAGLLN